MSNKTETLDLERPTTVQYTGLQQAYDYFNEKLFDGKLEQCVITLRPYGKATLGLFHAQQWVYRGVRTPGTRSP